MIRFVGRRSAYSLVALVGLMVVVFFLTRLTGSPASLYLPETATPEMIAEFNARRGFDLPLILQFGRFLGDTVRLDFGESLWQRQPALQAVLAAMPPTLLLTAITMVLALVVALVLGAAAANRKDRATDRAVTLFSLVCASVPEFWFALVMILVFAVKLGWLPTSGHATASAWVLPVATLMLGPVGALTQVVRGAMIDALRSGYMQNARARGLPAHRLTFRHALRNAALPIITVAGDRAASLLNGVLIVGTVFALPGIGSLIVQAVLNRDYAVLQAAVLVTGLAVLLLNFAIDVLYAVTDKRVRIS